MGSALENFGYERVRDSKYVRRYADSHGNVIQFNKEFKQYVLYNIRYDINVAVDEHLHFAIETEMHRLGWI